jgi:hypothetical protein
VIIPKPVGSARRALAAQLDPDFSAIVFEDFVTALHARLHEDRGGDHLDRWAMYASPDARAALTMPFGRYPLINQFFQNCLLATLKEWASKVSRRSRTTFAWRVSPREEVE